ncbi:MAG: radical SAM family heme chaperone HemW [Aquisalinus sp.]|nr:radical SAM family heme chaperone HemW [Aquisalinus sp.]
MAFGIYIHWPYCTRICPYCDFNVYRNRAVDINLWRDALTQDLKWFADQTGERALTSIYFGGGTPSLMPPALVASLIEVCKELWHPSDDIEINLEANPTDAEQARFRDFRSAGINRLSLGIQSFDDKALQFLGRNHSAVEARAALDLSLRTFERTTLDLIYARPEQSLADWQQELETALETGVQHLSLYQLTVEPDTAFQKAVDRKDWALPDDPVQADFYDLTQEICDAAGKPAYEVSNHAAPGDESHHNMLYWTYQDYIGIGPGAHGRLTKGTAKEAITGTSKPGDYLAMPPDAKFETEPLHSEDQATEYLLMGLRLNSGIETGKYEQLAGKPLSQARVTQLADKGLLEHDTRRCNLTPAGRKVLNQVVLQLLSDDRPAL